MFIVRQEVIAELLKPRCSGFWTTVVTLHHHFKKQSVNLSLPLWLAYVSRLWLLAQVIHVDGLHDLYDLTTDLKLKCAHRCA